MTEFEAWQGVKANLGSDIEVFRVQYQELLKPVRVHCSGCERCQSDYSCGECGQLMVGVYEALCKEYPSVEREIWGICFPERVDDDDDYLDWGEMAA